MKGIYVLKNKLFNVIIILTIISILFSGCELFKPIKFSELETGTDFWLNRDGYYKKLPHNYVLNVDLRTPASLFKVKEEHLYEEWGDVYTGYFDNPILEGHFIEGYFNSDYLVLCEEYEDRNRVYLIFEFATEEIEYYDTLDEIYTLFGVDSLDWFYLCNTVDQWVPVPDELLTADQAA